MPANHLTVHRISHTGTSRRESAAEMILPNKHARSFQAECVMVRVGGLILEETWSQCRLPPSLTDEVAEMNLNWGCGPVRILLVRIAVQFERSLVAMSEM